MNYYEIGRVYDVTRNAENAFFLELEIRFLAHRSLIKTSTCITNWFCFRSKKKNLLSLCVDEEF